MERLLSGRAVAVVAFLLIATPVHADIEQQPTTPKEALKAAPVMTKSPEMVTEVPPIYPDAARAEHRQGSVTVLVTMDATGHVAEVALKTSSGSPDLDAARWTRRARMSFRPPRSTASTPRSPLS